MRGREAKGAPSADLLVCFPSRAHLTLLPKHICSPARPSEPKHHQNNQNNHHHHPHHHHHHHHHLKKVNNRGGGSGGQASPLLWAKTKPMGLEISEPTSPKVTCAGQIKVRSKPTSCKNWQSVMEEIEKLHNNKKNKKRLNWVESLGIKKDIMQFLTCLRTIKFDFRCFGSFPTSDITSDDEYEDQDFQENQENMEDGNNETSRTVFSKWFMVLQEDQNNGFKKEVIKDSLDTPCAPPPPPNALLLMRCRSAPAKSWLEEREEEEEEREEGDDEEDEDHEERKEEEEKKKENLGVEEEKRKKEERLVVMRYDNDFYKISSDIAKETWVVGGIRDPLSRSRSWKR